MRIIGVYIFIIGLCNGSFIYWLTSHYLKGDSILEVNSKCDNCGHVLKAIDLVPIISWIILKGRCRYCNKKISITYPVVEAICGLIYLLIYLKFGISYKTIIYLILVSCLLFLSVVDIHIYEIPNSCLIISLTVWLILNYFENNISNLLYAIIIATYIFLLSLILKKILKKDCLGFGDVKLIFIITLYLGIDKISWCLLLSCLIGIVFILANKKEMIPFGPSLSIAFILVLLFSDKLII